jgi:flagellar motor switch protein FliN/FliY
MAPPDARTDPDAAYAQAFFNGCAAALSTLLNRAVTLDLVPGLLAGGEALATAVPLPWVLMSARFTRGLAGAHDLVFSMTDAIGIARLVLGEEPSEAELFTADHQDALRETVNQMFSSASSALRVFFGKPVGIAPAELRQVEHSDSWHPHVASIAVGVLTVDGVPRARLALTVPQSVRDEAATAQEVAAPAKGAGAPGGPMQPGLDLILDISMPVTVELGRTRMLIRDILALGPGSIIELDKLAGEPVDLLVNDRAIAKGEVVVIDENFGVRLTHIAQATDRIRSLS